MRSLQIIYLDPSLVAMAYEELAGVSAPTKITRSDDLSGDIGAGIFKISGGTRETKEFEISTTQMFFQIESRLRELPTKHAPEAFSAKHLFWTTGVLAVGEIDQKSNGKLIKEYPHFTIANEENKFEHYLNLVTRDAYFSSGYDQIATNKDVLGTGIWEPVEALLRPLLFNKHNSLHQFAPVTILRKLN